MLVSHVGKPRQILEGNPLKDFSEGGVPTIDCVDSITPRSIKLSQKQFCDGWVGLHKVLDCGDFPRGFSEFCKVKQ